MDQNCYYGKCGPKAMACGGSVKKMAEGGVVSNAMETVGRALNTERGRAMKAADEFLAKGRDDGGRGKENDEMTRDKRAYAAPKSK